MIPLIYHWTAINLFDIASEIRFFNSARNGKKDIFILTFLAEESPVAGIFKVFICERPVQYKSNLSVAGITPQILL